MAKSHVGYPVKLGKRVAKDKLEAVAIARRLLEDGREYRQQKRESTWRRSERQYEGKHWSDGQSPNDPLADLITVNLSFSTVNVIMPYVTGNEPAFTVSPASGDATFTGAKAQEAMLTRWWRSSDSDAQPAIENAVVDALIYGDGFVKLGYDITERMVDEGEMAEVASIWAQRISVWDLWMDPMADGVREGARWVCQRIRLPYGELTASGRYHNTDWGNVGQMSRTATDDSDRPDALDHDTSFHGEYDEFTMVEIYEFYDLVNRRLITFAEGELPLQWVEGIGGVSIVQMSNYPLPGSPYHIGELEQTWDLQMELNKTRSQMATHRRRNIPKYFSRDGALGEDAIDALQSEVVNDVAIVHGSDPIQDLIYSVQMQPLTGDVYAMSETITGDIYEITGVNEYLRGAAPNIRRTATEASIIEGASNTKTSAKLRMVERAIKHVGKLFLSTAADIFPETAYDEVAFFLTGREAEAVSRASYGDQVAQLRAAGKESAAQQMEMAVANQPPENVTVTPSADIFVGAYEVEIGSASTELRNPIMREQKYKDMTLTLASLTPVLAQSGVQIDFAPLLRQWLEAAGIGEVDDVIIGGSNGAAAAPGMAQQAGRPQLSAVKPPTDPLSSLNTGALTPTG